MLISMKWCIHYCLSGLPRIPVHCSAGGSCPTARTTRQGDAAQLPTNTGNGNRNHVSPTPRYQNGPYDTTQHRRDDCGPSPVTDESTGGKAGHRGANPYAPCTTKQCSTTSSPSHVNSPQVK